MTQPERRSLALCSESYDSLSELQYLTRQVLNKNKIPLARSKTSYPKIILALVKSVTPEQLAQLLK
jgi:hypothetical protein